MLSLTNVGFAVPTESTDDLVLPAAEAVAPQTEQVNENEAPAEEPGDPVPEPSLEAAPVTQEPEAPAPAEESLIEEPEKAAVDTELVVEPAVEPAVEPETDLVAMAESIVAPLALVDPNTVAGNPRLGPGCLRVDGAGTYTHTFMGIDITVVVTVVDTPSGPEFSFTSDYPVMKVVAKGGRGGANVYTYAGILSDSGLHTPMNPSGKWAGISHIDFCFAPPADIEVVKFHDLDGDGVHDEGEPMLDGWMIRLLKGDVVVDSGLTVDGKITFENVRPGAYALDEIQAAGWTNTTMLPMPITVVSGQGATYHIGNRMIPDVTKTFTLTYANAPEGAEFFAIYNLVEGPDVEVALLPIGGGEFSGSVELPQGSVIESVMWKAVHDGMTYMLGSQLGIDEELDEDMTNRFTYAASVSGHKFGDMNADGIWGEGEIGMAGWTIGLYRATEQVMPSALPTPVEGFELVAQTVTGAGGVYSFSGLLPGTYYVAEEMQAGWSMTVAPMGTFAVLNGTALTDLDFGNTEPVLPLTIFEFSKSADTTVAAPGDLVTYTLTYRLADGSDAWTAPIPVIDDFDERYMTPVDVAGGVVTDGKITWTDEADLLPGQVRTIVYTMRVIAGMPVGTTRIDNVALLNVQQGYQDDWAVTVQVLPREVTKTFTLTYANAPEGAELFAVYNLVEGPDVEVALLSIGGGEFSGSVELPYGSMIESVMWKAVHEGRTFVLGTQLGIDEEIVEDMTNRFTYAASISGHKFGDMNADGVWGEGEIGLSGWTIGLYRATEQVMPSALPTPAEGFELVAQTVTGAGGVYSFSGLLPGTYYVAEEMQAGWTMTVGPLGTFAVLNGTALTGLDFGNTEPMLPFTMFEFSKSANMTVAEPGDLVTYTLTYWLADGSDAWTAPIPVIDDFDERYMTPVDVAGGVVTDGMISWIDEADLLPGQVRTIVYTMRVIADMPVGTTRIDNVALLNVQQGYQDDWAVTVQVDDPFLPFTPTEDEEPFLPFTGGEALLIVLAALAAGALGVTLRRLAVQAK